MKGVAGIILLIFGAFFLYDVFSGKASAVIGLLNGQTEQGQFIGRGTVPSVNTIQPATPPVPMQTVTL